jgi:hypothetical protein
MSEKLIAESVKIMLEYFVASFESQGNIPTEWGKCAIEQTF